MFLSNLVINLLIVILYFLSFSWFFLFFNFVLHFFISFNFYIKFDFYLFCFFNYFLDWFFFSISSINIWKVKIFTLWFDFGFFKIFFLNLIMSFNIRHLALTFMIFSAFLIMGLSRSHVLGRELVKLTRIDSGFFLISIDNFS